MTDATSAGWPMRFSACIPITTVAALFGLGEVRHVGVDHAGRDGIDADAARAERRGEVLHQRVDGALGRCVGRQRADGGARAERRDEHDAAPST